jgi:DNA-binding NarL/FixJ family response regulator
MSKELRDRRTRRIEELLKQGLALKVIAERLGVTQRQVRSVRDRLRQGAEA